MPRLFTFTCVVLAVVFANRAAAQDDEPRASVQPPGDAIPAESHSAPHPSHAAPPPPDSRPNWASGGYEGRVGSPYYYGAGPGWGGFRGSAQNCDPAYPSQSPQEVFHDPYTAHFGPGFHRHSTYGHYRFPYYSYRAPWYFPGHAVYNRDTNFVW